MSQPVTTRPAVLVARAIFPDIIEQLSRHFDVEANPDDALWPREELVRRLQGKQGVFTTGSERIDAALLAQCPGLRICANMAVGYNNFDLPAMTAAGVLATNAPGVLTETTADMGFALLMAAARRVTEGEHFLRAGRWDRWAYDMLIGQDVHGSTLGIIGMGRIGQAIARRGALGFGMRVIYHNRSRLPEADEAAVGARYVSKQELLRTADHVMLVVPYSAESHHIIGAAGLDVFEGEPRVHPELLACRNVVLTPHIGSATVPTRRAMARLAADNLIGYLLHGKPLTPLNPQVATA